MLQISYEPLWATLVRRNMKKIELTETISSAALQKLKNNEPVILISDYYSKSCGSDFSFWQGVDPQACWMQVKGLQRSQGEKALHRIAGLI